MAGIWAAVPLFVLSVLVLSLGIYGIAWLMDQLDRW